MAVNLISTTSLVQTPYIKVTIGNYSFGCYNPSAWGSKKYPNYVKSLEVTKINGQVNQYNLRIEYTITEQDDPNYFEKVFASVSDTRNITFTYGDLSASNFIYKEESAIITKVQSDFGIDSSIISYTVNAVSNGALSGTGSYPFPAPLKKVKPSEVIKNILKQNDKYGLKDLFPGMRNDTLVASKLIPQNDIEVTLESKTNMSVLDYLQYLVDMMTPSNTTSSVARGNFYIMTFIDDTTDEFGGAYFKIVQVSKAKQYPEAYELYIGYPSSNAVRNLRINNNENYSIYYKYQDTLHPEKYVKRINALGEWEDVYAPILSSDNPQYKTTEAEKSWWSKTSQYPITASVEIKGLLRPAILMSYLRVYVSFFGRLHIHSGVYIITKQVDTIDEQGYRTTLNMSKIANDPTLSDEGFI